MQPQDIQIWFGVDVGKTGHWGTAITSNRKILWNKALPNDEAKIRQILTRLSTKGQVLVVVDQCANIGALTIAVAQDVGLAVAYLPGLAMRQMADMFPREAKTDKQDAYIIATTALAFPEALRTLKLSDENDAQLRMLTGFDEDLAKSITQTKNRLRGLLTQIHLPLEQFLGPRLSHRHLGSPENLAHPKSSQTRRQNQNRHQLKKHGARLHTA